MPQLIFHSTYRRKGARLTVSAGLGFVWIFGCLDLASFVMSMCPIIQMSLIFFDLK